MPITTKGRLCFRVKECQRKRNRKQAGVTVFISDKIDLKVKLMRKISHFIVIRETIHQEDLMIINTRVQNRGASNFIKHWILPDAK